MSNKLDLSEWEFGLEDVGKKLMTDYVEQVARVLLDEIKGNVSLDWYDTDIDCTIWLGDYEFKAARISLEDIVDHCFDWDMRSSSEDGQSCLRIAAEMEKQAARLRKGVAHADAEHNENKS